MRVPSGNLSSGSSSSVVIYQGGIAHFNIPLPVEDLGPFFLFTVVFASFCRLIITGCQTGLGINYCSYVYALDERHFSNFMLSMLKNNKIIILSEMFLELKMHCYGL